MYVSTVVLAAVEGMWLLLHAMAGLPLLWLMIKFYRKPKPAERPKGYRGWPLWFVGMAFIHNRRFGMLFLAGLAIQLFADAYIL